MKAALYLIAVACFFAAGTMDLLAREYKAGIIAILFGLANTIIFLWR